MKKRIFFAFLIALTSAVYADNDGENPKLIMKSLIDKQKKIDFFESYFSDVTLVQGRPMVDISYVDGNKDNSFPLPNKKNSTLVMTIRPLSVPLSERINAMQETQGLMNFFQSFMATTINVKTNESGEKGKTIRFDYFDGNKKLRLSRWFNAETGFENAYAYYAPDETLKSVSLYSFVKFKKSNEIKNDPNNIRHASFELLARKLDHLNVNTVEGLIDFVNKVIEMDLLKDRDRD